jgi:catechol 2,3-dioxygenase-like lactoylglutathione lyase family enzyme
LLRAADDRVRFGMQIHRGRLLDHVHLVVADIAAAKRFYTAALGALEIPLGGEAADHVWFDELFISTTDSQAAAGQLTGRVHLAFQATSRDAVDRFYAAGLEAGGRDNGQPGERPYHPGYYAGFLIDPEGNNIEAVYHGPAKASARSIVIDF